MPVALSLVAVLQDHRDDPKGIEPLSNLDALMPQRKISVTTAGADDNGGGLFGLPGIRPVDGHSWFVFFLGTGGVGRITGPKEQGCGFGGEDA